MTRQIKHIDKIAREKQRTVLFVSFEDPNQETQIFKAPNHHNLNYENDANRNELIKWLHEQSIGWESCSHVASETGFMSYNGNIYIDIPWDENDPQFVNFQQRLEREDGTPRNPLVKIWACDLDLAMKNAHHDEPGFWEDWAKTF